MRRIDRRKHPGDGNSVNVSLERAGSLPHFLLIQLGQGLTVILMPAVQNGMSDADDLLEIVRPGQERLNRAGCWRPKADDPDRIQFPASDHGIGAVRGAEHGVGDRVWRELRVGEDVLQGLDNPGGDIRSGLRLGTRNNLVCGIEYHGIGVCAANIDTEPKRAVPAASLLGLVRGFSCGGGHSLCRSQNTADPPAQSPQGCATGRGTEKLTRRCAGRI